MTSFIEQGEFYFSHKNSFIEIGNSSDSFRSGGSEGLNCASMISLWFHLKIEPPNSQYSSQQL